MGINEQVHYQIIRIAVGYALAGLTIATAFTCILSIVRVKNKKSGTKGSLIEIQPPWLRKSLYSSVVLELVCASVLLFKQILAVNTREVSDKVSDSIAVKAVESAKADLQKIGILRYWERANDFLPSIRQSMLDAKAEIFISGASFYLSVPDNEDILIQKAKEGVVVKYLILDPRGINLSAVASTFSQAEEELRAECEITVKALERIINRLPSDKRGNLQVRFFDESPRARFYVFDPDDSSSVTYFVPHANSVNSPQLPGFQLSNRQYGLAKIYISSLREFWEKSLSFEDWKKKSSKG